MAQKSRGRELELADGKMYRFMPLPLGAIEEMGDDLENFNPKGFDKHTVGVIKRAAFYSLRRCHPEITESDLSQLLDVSMLFDVMDAVMDLTGLLEQAESMGKILPQSNGYGS